MAKTTQQTQPTVTATEAATTPPTGVTSRPVILEPASYQPRAAPDTPQAVKSTPLPVTQMLTLRPDGRKAGGNFSLLRVMLFDHQTQRTRKLLAPMVYLNNIQGLPLAQFETIHVLNDGAGKDVPQVFEDEYASEAERDAVLASQTMEVTDPVTQQVYRRRMWGQNGHDPAAHRPGHPLREVVENQATWGQAAKDVAGEVIKAVG